MAIINVTPNIGSIIEVTAKLKDVIVFNGTGEVRLNGYAIITASNENKTSFYVDKAGRYDTALGSVNINVTGLSMDGDDIRKAIGANYNHPDNYVTFKDNKGGGDIEGLVDKIEDNTSLLGGDIKSLWNPPTQPARDSIIADADKFKYQKYVDLWEGLRLKDPEYIKRTNLGKDQSGLYDIWKYEFIPKNYEKTIIINANIHGMETTGQLMWYRLMYHVVNDHNKYPQLNYIRNKVRIVSIPIQNPWGLVNFTRENSRDVDLNRNFDYKWAESDGKKGTGPMSEAEAVITNNMLKDYHDAVLYLDLHNTESNMAYNYYGVVPRFFEFNRDVIFKTINAVKPIPTVANNIQQSQQPIAANNGAANHGLQSAIIEWVPGTMSPAAYDSTDYTYAVKFLGNLIFQLVGADAIELASVDQATTIFASNPYIYSLTSTPGVWEELQGMSIEFNPKVDGILIITGTTMIHNVSAVAGKYNSVVPVITQSGNDLLLDALILDQQNQADVFMENTGKRVPLSFNRTVPIRAQGYLTGPVTVKVFLKTEDGVITHRKTRLSATFIPTNAPVAYKSIVTGSSGTPNQAYPKL